MNKQRKVLITTTYNEMGIIIDTKAEEVTQPNLQPTCNQLATDCISRRAAIDAIAEHLGIPAANWKDIAKEWLKDLPTAQPEMVKCKKCRYVHYDEEFDNYWCNRMSGSFKVEADGYCKWGK